MVWSAVSRLAFEATLRWSQRTGLARELVTASGCRLFEMSVCVSSLPAAALPSSQHPRACAVAYDLWLTGPP